MKKRNITVGQIHPQLRAAGCMIRFVLPSFSERTFRLCNRVQKRGRFPSRCKEMRAEERFLARSDGRPEKLRLCVFRPLHQEKPGAGVLWLHGGGYAIGRPEQDMDFIRLFVRNGCTVVAPDYTLSTERPYPAALLDCYDALRWMKENALSCGIREDQLMVGGESAGGGLCAALCLYARDRGEVAVSFQMPLYPMLDDRPTLSSSENDAPVWNTASNEEAWRLYLGERFGKENVPAYAACARAENYRGLPPALSYIGSIDPFYEETKTYMKALRAAGIPAHCKVLKGCWHGFDLVVPGCAPARAARAYLEKGLRYALTHYYAPQSAVAFRREGEFCSGTGNGRVTEGQIWN
ncbi:MAG: alpha/beta hydrolase [Eubacteriales bacterium]|nr:alpha/beta hydrolase [Eubacteriales bacterium]